jgi:hypothetical protein
MARQIKVLFMMGHYYCASCIEEMKVMIEVRVKVMHVTLNG